jgi:hypothetical protein
MIYPDTIPVPSLHKCSHNGTVDSIARSAPHGRDVTLCGTLLASTSRNHMDPQHFGSFAAACAASALCVTCAVTSRASAATTVPPQQEPEPEPEASAPASRRRAAPKKSAKKWQQLRDKRLADAQLRVATAASYDPTTLDLARPADAAAASAALAIRAWTRLRSTCDWQGQPSAGSSEQPDPPDPGGDDDAPCSPACGGQVATLSEADEVALAGMFRAAYKTCETRVRKTPRILLFLNCSYFTGVSLQPVLANHRVSLLKRRFS